MYRLQRYKKHYCWPWHKKVTNLSCRNGFAQIQKTVMDKTGSRPPTVTITFFDVVSASETVGCRRKSSTFHHMPQSYQKRGHKRRTKDWRKRWLFWLSLNSCGTHLSSFFDFPSSRRLCFPLRRLILHKISTLSTSNGRSLLSPSRFQHYRHRCGTS